MGNIIWLTPLMLYIWQISILISDLFKKQSIIIIYGCVFFLLLFVSLSVSLRDRREFFTVIWNKKFPPLLSLFFLPWILFYFSVISLLHFSVAKLCPTLCDLMNCSLPVFLVLHYLPVCSNSCPLSWWCLQPSHPLSPPSCPQSFPASGSFPMSWHFTSGCPKYWSFNFSISGQSIGASASVLVLPVNIQSWFPLGLTG